MPDIQHIAAEEAGLAASRQALLFKCGNVVNDLKPSSIAGQLALFIRHHFRVRGVSCDKYRMVSIA